MRRTELNLMHLTAPVLAAAAILSVASADVVTLQPSKDNTLIESPTGENSNGAGDGIYSGRTGNFGGAVRLRAVLRFDLSSIPAGSTINSVSLTLNMLQTVSGNQTHTLHRLQADWGEGASSSHGGMGAPSEAGDATWIHTFYPSSFWASPGGDFAATASDTRIVGAAGPYTWTSAAMVADVQQWVNSPPANFGWILLGNEASLNTAKKFASREHVTMSLRPSLTIDFTPPSTKPCPADIAPPGGDGVVNVNDLLAVINAWGPCPAPPSPCPADISPPGGDGVVNVNDLLGVINAWGPCP